MLLLVVVAVPAERSALLRRLGAPQPLQLGPWEALRVGEVAVVAGGAGPGAAGAATAGACARLRPDAVVSAGIAGGVPGAAAVGDVVVATAGTAADLGADSPDGFLPLDALGLGSPRVPTDPVLSDALATRLAAGGNRVHRGEVLTVSTVTGTAARAAALAAAHPAAVAEAMEGHAVLAAAAAEGLPATEVRTISNAVGPRDRDAWDLPAALAGLERCGLALADLAARRERPADLDASDLRTSP